MLRKIIGLIFIVIGIGLITLGGYFLISGKIEINSITVTCAGIILFISGIQLFGKKRLKEIIEDLIMIPF